MDAHGLGEVGALGVDVDVLVADPAQAVAGDLVAGVEQRVGPPAGSACSARATAKMVSGSPRSANSRRTRHTPARLPYS